MSNCPTGHKCTWSLTKGNSTSHSISNVNWVRINFQRKEHSTPWSAHARARQPRATPEYFADHSTGPVWASWFETSYKSGLMGSTLSSCESHNNWTGVSATTATTFAMKISLRARIVEGYSIIYKYNKFFGNSRSRSLCSFPVYSF